MDRFLRFSARGAELAWRVKNGAKSVPLKTIRTLPDGSELVMLRESDGMRTRRRRETGDPHAERLLPDTTARLVTFTILTETRSGRRKTTQVRILTTLLDHQQHPASEIAVLDAERWQIEIAFLHLKKTVRGARRALRGQSPDLARQEAWALLLIHNITAAAIARAAATAGIDPGLIPFTAVLGLIRGHLTADTPCRYALDTADGNLHGSTPTASLNAAILALREPAHASGHPGQQLQRPTQNARTEERPTPSKNWRSRSSAEMETTSKLKGSALWGDSCVFPVSCSARQLSPAPAGAAMAGRSAAANKAVWADVRGQFAYHEICDSGSWLHSADLFALSSSYHLTAAGQGLGYLPVFARFAG